MPLVLILSPLENVFYLFLFICALVAPNICKLIRDTSYIFVHLPAVPSRENSTLCWPLVQSSALLFLTSLCSVHGWHATERSCVTCSCTREALRMICDRRMSPQVGISCVLWTTCFLTKVKLIRCDWTCTLAPPREFTKNTDVWVPRQRFSHSTWVMICAQRLAKSCRWSKQ